VEPLQVNNEEEKKIKTLLDIDSLSDIVICKTEIFGLLLLFVSIYSVFEG
jgi:hypothetical protein